MSMKSQKSIGGVYSLHDSAVVANTHTFRLLLPFDGRGKDANTALCWRHGGVARRGSDAELHCGLALLTDSNP